MKRAFPKGYAYALKTWDKRFINVLEDFMVTQLKILSKKDIKNMW